MRSHPFRKNKREVKDKRKNGKRIYLYLIILLIKISRTLRTKRLELLQNHFHFFLRKAWLPISACSLMSRPLAHTCKYASAGPLLFLPSFSRSAERGREKGIKIFIFILLLLILKNSKFMYLCLSVLLTLSRSRPAGERKK